jgi:hypothetical protein
MGRSRLEPEVEAYIARVANLLECRRDSFTELEELTLEGLYFDSVPAREAVLYFIGAAGLYEENQEE